MEHPVEIMHRTWNILSSEIGQQQNQVQWRRDKVQELCSKGYSQREISQTLQVGLATVNRDVSIRY
jgi:Trp operon repressor